MTAGLLAAGVFAGCSRETGTERGAGAGSAQSIRGGQLVASQRTEPANYNRYFEATAAAELVTQLTQAKLVRVNRSSDEVEPALAESWSTTDGLTYSVKLRPNVRFSDGAPFSSADVVFSFQAAQDSPGSVLASGLRVGGKPLTVVATDPGTVRITFPHRFAPAIRMLDNLPILPRHKLLAAFEAKTLKDAWTPAKPASEVVGLGPFVLSEHVSGQRLVLNRNPHYWRRDRSGTALPYLDKVTLLLVPDQSAEVLRLEAGAIDLMANADTQPENYGRLKQLSTEGKLHLIDGGVGLDANVFWFNLKAKPGMESRGSDRRNFVRHSPTPWTDRPSRTRSTLVPRSRSTDPSRRAIAPGFRDPLRRIRTMQRRRGNFSPRSVCAIAMATARSTTGPAGRSVFRS